MTQEVGSKRGVVCIDYVKKANFIALKSIFTAWYKNPFDIFRNFRFRNDQGNSTDISKYTKSSSLHFYKIA